MRLGAGRECGHFFVPDMDPFDLALATHRVGDPVQAISDDAVDSFDSRRSEGFSELIRNRPHMTAPLYGVGVRNAVCRGSKWGGRAN